MSKNKSCEMVVFIDHPAGMFLKGIYFSFEKQKILKIGSALFCRDHGA